MSKNRSKIARYIGPVTLMALQDAARGAAARRLDFFAAHGGPDALHHGEPMPATPPRGSVDLVMQHIDLH